MIPDRRPTTWLLLILAGVSALAGWWYWPEIEAALPGLVALWNKYRDDIVAVAAVVGVPIAVVGMVVTVAAYRASRRDRPRGVPAPRSNRLSTSPLDEPETSLPPETIARLCRLMLHLPRWSEDQVRRNFLDGVFGMHHALIGDIQWEGSPRDVTLSVIKTCADHAVPGGPSALCTLLAAIPQEFPRHAGRDDEIAELKVRLGCR